MLTVDHSLWVFLGEKPSIKRDHFIQVYVPSPGMSYSLWLAMGIRRPDTLILIWNNSEGPSQFQGFPWDHLSALLQRHGDLPSPSAQSHFAHALTREHPKKPPACQSLPLSLISGEPDLRQMCCLIKSLSFFNPVKGKSVSTAFIGYNWGFVFLSVYRAGG